MPDDPFETELARLIWDGRYRDRSDGEVRDHRVQDTWRRVARALTALEPRDRPTWEDKFYRLLDGFGFLPGGRILAGAGTGHDRTLFNCFVMGTLGDSMEAIFEALKEGALTMQAGGGIGYDFSPLRPQGLPARRSGGLAAGPVSFMRIWDTMCETLLSTAARRGAMMATLRCDHPDIESFIDAKRDQRALRNFNLSVLVTDDFMEAVRADRPWPLVFPLDNPKGTRQDGNGPVVTRRLPGHRDPRPCAVTRALPARALWDRIMATAYDTAEPGVLFVDRIDRENNLWYRERISATNPCGEVPLPPYGACTLGSLNLVRFVERPFSPAARMDLTGLGAATATAVRLLDNVIDASPLPLPQQAEQARGARRLGLGITGLADALILLGLHYGSPEARAMAARIMERICHAAYRASIDLARERGPFPFFEPAPYLDGPFVRSLPMEFRALIRSQGIRNSHLTAIAPAGTISLFANGVSSGLEPVFAFEHRRRVHDRTGEPTWHRVTDYALRHWRLINGDRPLLHTFVGARDLAPGDHLAMQAALQPFVDNAIAKTINVPRDIGLESFRTLYSEAYHLGLKGCTVFRPQSAINSVLTGDNETGEVEEHRSAVPCCEVIGPVSGTNPD
jgi:ribonucleoside-diphosphate reductase alpha chain